MPLPLGRDSDCPLGWIQIALFLQGGIQIAPFPKIAPRAGFRFRFRFSVLSFKRRNIQNLNLNLNLPGWFEIGSWAGFRLLCCPEAGFRLRLGRIPPSASSADSDCPLGRIQIGLCSLNQIPIAYWARFGLHAVYWARFSSKQILLQIALSALPKLRTSMSILTYWLAFCPNCRLCGCLLGF